MKRVFVSLPDGVWSILKRDFLNKVGDSESEVIRNLVIAYLSEHGYFVNTKGYEDTEDIRDKLDVTMKLLESVIDTLEEKTDVTYADIDRTMKRRIHEMTADKT
jgi:hypothetical protein